MRSRLTTCAVLGNVQVQCPRRLVSSTVSPTPCSNVPRRTRRVAPSRTAVGADRCAPDEPPGDECSGETDKG